MRLCAPAPGRRHAPLHRQARYDARRRRPACPGFASSPTTRSELEARTEDERSFCGALWMFYVVAFVCGTKVSVFRAVDLRWAHRRQAYLAPDPRLPLTRLEVHFSLVPGP